MFTLSNGSSRTASVSATTNTRKKVRLDNPQGKVCEEGQNAGGMTDPVQENADEKLNEDVNVENVEEDADANDETDVAKLIRQGDACGHCRKELFEHDDCFECNHHETRGSGRERYIYDVECRCKVGRPRWVEMPIVHRMCLD